MLCQRSLAVRILPQFDDVVAVCKTLVGGGGAGQRADLDDALLGGHVVVRLGGEAFMLLDQA
ncbi:hypothetical protein D3C78_1673140 [compost metagenome]